jgi:hypothetical protein
MEGNGAYIDTILPYIVALEPIYTCMEGNGKVMHGGIWKVMTVGDIPYQTPMKVVHI